MFQKKYTLSTREHGLAAFHRSMLVRLIPFFSVLCSCGPFTVRCFFSTALVSSVSPLSFRTCSAVWCSRIIVFCINEFHIVFVAVLSRWLFMQSPASGTYTTPNASQLTPSSNNQAPFLRHTQDVYGGTLLTRLSFVLLLQAALACQPCAPRAHWEPGGAFPAIL